MSTQTVILLILIAAVVCGVRLVEKKLDGKPKESAGKRAGESRPAERTSRKAVDSTQPR